MMSTTTQKRADDNSLLSEQSLILSMNNLAVSSFLKGDADDSIEVLRHALANLRNLLEWQVLSSLQTLENSLLQGKNGCSEHYPVFDRDCLACTQRQFFPVAFEVERQEAHNAEECRAFEEASCGGSFAFFNRVLTLNSEVQPPGQTENSPSGDPEVTQIQCQNRMLVMLLYNMGVYHHISAIRCGTSSEWATALRLYELAFSIMETSCQDFAIGDQVLLLLSLYNQMGHIHANFFCNALHAQICVQRMQQIFYYCQLASRQHEDRQHDGHRDPCSSLDREEYNFFYQYMPMSVRQQGSIASAA